MSALAKKHFAGIIYTPGWKRHGQALDRPLIILTALSWIGFAPPRDCSTPRPFPALLFGRIVDARLRTSAANPFEKAHRQDNARRATHIRLIARRHAIFQAFCRLLIFNKLALEAQTIEDRSEARHAQSADWFCACEFRKIPNE